MGMNKKRGYAVWYLQRSLVFLLWRIVHSQAELAKRSSLLHVAHLDEVFGNLNGVEGCSLLNLVAREP